MQSRRTVFTIAHRISTIKSADCVVCLEGGTVAEVGPYAELLKKENGVFKKLVENQLITWWKRKEKSKKKKRSNKNQVCCFSTTICLLLSIDEMDTYPSPYPSIFPLLSYQYQCPPMMCSPLTRNPIIFFITSPAWEATPLLLTSPPSSPPTLSLTLPVATHLK